MDVSFPVSTAEADGPTFGKCMVLSKTVQKKTERYEATSSAGPNLTRLQGLSRGVVWPCLWWPQYGV